MAFQYARLSDDIEIQGYMETHHEQVFAYSVVVNVFNVFCTLTDFFCFIIIFQKKQKRKKTQNIVEVAKSPHYEYVENQENMDMLSAPDVIEEPRIRKPSSKSKTTITQKQTLQLDETWFESHSDESKLRVKELNKIHQAHSKIKKEMAEV